MRQRQFRRRNLAIACGVIGAYIFPTQAADPIDIYDLSLEELMQVNISTNRTPAAPKQGWICSTIKIVSRC